MELNSFQALKKASDLCNIEFVSGYMGYIASNFLAQFPNVTQAINESTAIAMAHVNSYLGKRSLVIMKNAGLNQGALPFRNACDLGVNAAMIIIFSDDVTADMSENQQDSRRYYDIGKTILFEPKSPGELYQMIKEACKLSEKIKLPILIRVTNALDNKHWMEEIPEEKLKITRIKRAKRDQSSWMLHPKTADGLAAKHKKKFKEILKYVEKSRFNTILGNGNPICIYSQALVESEKEKLADFKTIIKIGTFPLPQKKIQSRIKNNKNVTIIDTGEGFLEEEIKESYGKNLKVTEIVRNYPPLEINQHLAYNFLWKLISGRKPSFVCGDFGSYTLSKGSILEYSLFYGAAIASGVGAALAKEKKVYVVIGEGAFTSGMENLFEAIRKKVKINIVLIKNKGISDKEPINLDILEICKQKGIDYVKEVDYTQLTNKHLEQMEKVKGVSILIIDYSD